MEYGNNVSGKGKPMSSQAEQIATSSPVQEHAQTRPRLFFVDHLRVALTMLVITHHLAITYGAFGGVPGLWYYIEPTKDSVASGLLSLFVLLNQGFFMGCFFLLSGYFTPGSYERKGPGAFLRDRLLRLGIPLLIFVLLIAPITTYIGAGVSVSFWQFVLDYGGFGFGPLWFVELLLIFVCVYALWRWLTRNQAAPSDLSASKPLTMRTILLFMLVMTVITFVVRIWAPAGWWFQPLNLQFAYLPQYIALFVVGVIGVRRNWFLTLPASIGKIGLGIALGATIVLFPVIVLFSAESFGGFHWQAFVYALWESLFYVGLCLALLVFFRERFNRQGRLGKFLSANAYTVYVIHALVIVCLSYAFGALHLYPLLKFVLMVLIAIPLCFVCAFLVCKIPFARNIL